MVCFHIYIYIDSLTDKSLFIEVGDSSFHFRSDDWVFFTIFSYFYPHSEFFYKPKFATHSLCSVQKERCGVKGFGFLAILEESWSNPCFDLLILFGILVFRQVFD